MDIFEMMQQNGITVPVTPVQESTKKAIKADKTAVKAEKKEISKPAPKPETLYKLPLSIYYSGFEHQISEEEYEIEALTQEQLLNHLRVNFNYRVLTDKRTTLEYDAEAGEVIVHLKNPTKGSFIDGLHAYKFEDGQCRFVKKASFGHIIGPVDQIVPKNTLIVDGRPGVFLTEKIPGSFLQEIISRFTLALPNEAMVEIYYNKITKKYTLHWPEQETTRISVDRESSSFFKDSKKNMLFAEIHSHGHYPGKFSSTDDENELDFLIYGVVGQLDARPSIDFRIGFNGLFYAIDFLNVFDLDNMGGAV